MGSEKIQGELWGKRPDDWASIQEKTGNAGYEYVIKYLNLNANLKLLDIGCGSGLFCNMINTIGLDISGLDASGPLIERAKLRNSAINFVTGEMEQLPFGDQYFDVVSGFNSFQYAANIANALNEAHRVLKTDGSLAVMIWGNKEDCEAASYLKAVGSLMAPKLPGASGPFALSENKLLETNLEAAGFKIIHQKDIDAIWDYPDEFTALKGIMSAGTVARAIDYSGYEKVYNTLKKAIEPFLQKNGHIVYRNKFRVIISV